MFKRILRCCILLLLGVVVAACYMNVGTYPDHHRDCYHYSNGHMSCYNYYY